MSGGSQTLDGVGSAEHLPSSESSFELVRILSNLAGDGAEKMASRPQTSLVKPVEALSSGSISCSMDMIRIRRLGQETRY